MGPEPRHGGEVFPAAEPPTTTHRLEGCAARPLSSYLKALGVFRVVATQVDPSARAGWTRDGVLELSTRLDRARLLSFFLEDYRPTPLLSPWNRDAGLICVEDRVEWSRPEARALAADEVPERFASIAGGLRTARRILQDLADLGALPTKKGKLDFAGSGRHAKDAFLLALRAELPDEDVDVLDAVAVLTDRGFDFGASPVWLGGNDGRLDFSSAYLRLLVGTVRKGATTGPLFGFDGRPHPWTERALEAALFGEAAAVAGRDTMGLLNPVATGGPNAGTGYQGDARTNPWEFVLAVEGSALLAGSATRRHGVAATRRSRAAVPFRVDATAAGQGGLGMVESDARAELWLPRWGARASLREVRKLFGEGRVQVGRRPVERGLDFVRALATLGTDRGFDAFERFGVIQRNGKSNLAVALGTWRVTGNRGVRLLDDLDGWAWRVERRVTSTSPGAPAGLRSAWRRYEEQVFAWCEAREGADRLHAGAVLRALGRLEAELEPRRGGGEGDAALVPPPLPPLPSRRWRPRVKENASEYRIAEALASLVGRRRGGGAAGSSLDAFRVHVEAVRLGPRWKRVDWAIGSKARVWEEGSLERALARVFARRMLMSDAWEHPGSAGPADPRRAVGSLPGECAAWGAHLDDVAAFLDGRLDEGLLEAWLRGLVLLRWDVPGPASGPAREPWRLPGAPEGEAVLVQHGARSHPVDPLYALLRLCFSGGALRDRSGRVLRPDAQLFRLALAGRGREASRRAARVLRAAGYAPLLPQVEAGPERARRAAAALAIPITLGSLAVLAETVLGGVPPLWP